MHHNHAGMPLHLAAISISEYCWASIAQGDPGPSVVHAPGPDGHAFKSVNLCSDSSYAMQKKGGAAE
eukprot:9038146-Pyramimonas_sp.AAC.1